MATRIASIIAVTASCEFFVQSPYDPGYTGYPWIYRDREKEEEREEREGGGRKERGEKEGVAGAYSTLLSNIHVLCIHGPPARREEAAWSSVEEILILISVNYVTSFEA